MRHGLIRLLPPFLIIVAIVFVHPSRAGETHAPLPDERLGIRTAPLLLLSRADVRDDLKLTPKQAVEAEKAITDLYVRADDLRGKTGIQVIEARKAIDEAQRDWFERHLTAVQQNRLVQIDLQWEGPSSLISRPVLADTLGLSSQQRTSLKEAVAKRNLQRTRKMDAPADEQVLARQALSLLQTAQKEQWRAMLGRPFVPQLAARPDNPATRRK